MLDDIKIKWLGHASIKVAGEKTVYVDPWKISETDPADLILVTHEHFDHCSPDDVQEIQSDKTIIVTTADCKPKLSGNVEVMGPGDSRTVDGVQIEAVPAYNINKQFHPKENAWVGFIFTLNGKRIYHPGDTDFIPEMEGIKADIAFFPVGGKYTMDAEEAAKAANAVKPQIAIPMHYGDIVGGAADAEKFKELCEVEVRILEAEA